MGTGNQDIVLEMFQRLSRSLIHVLPTEQNVIVGEHMDALLREHLRTGADGLPLPTFGAGEDEDEFDEDLEDEEDEFEDEDDLDRQPETNRRVSHQSGSIDRG